MKQEQEQSPISSKQKEEALRWDWNNKKDNLTKIETN